MNTEAVAQLVDGLCGLIPEAGGAVCAIIAFAIAFQIAMPIVPGRLLPAVSLMSAAPRAPPPHARPGRRRGGPARIPRLFIV